VSGREPSNFPIPKSGDRRLMAIKMKGGQQINRRIWLREFFESFVIPHLAFRKPSPEEQAR